MSQRVSFTLHEIATDGLPDMDALTGRVAFIFDGCVVSGWPVADEFLSAGDREAAEGQALWEGNSDVADHRLKANVTHWLEFDQPVWEMT